MIRISPANICWFLGYLAMLAAIWFGLSSYRTAAMEDYGSDREIENWQEWRDGALGAGEDGEVERDIPGSAEPPALVLMRDHFAACLGISLLLSSCLYVWFMFCARGAMKPVQLHYEDDELRS